MTAELPRRAQAELDARAAALRGASLAFGNGKPVVKPKPEIHNYSGKNGALAAATVSAANGGQSNGFGNAAGNLGGRSGGVHSGGRPLSMQELLQGEKDAARLRGIEESSMIKRQSSGSSVQSERLGNTGRGRGTGRGTGQLRGSEYNFGTNDGGGGGNGSRLLRPDQSRSASFIAANLAASRSASVSPNPTGTMRQPMSPAEMRIPPRYGSRSPSVRSADSSRGSLEQALDTRSIPPTGSLIGMFEQNGGQSGSEKPLRRFNTSASIQPQTRVSHPTSVTPATVRSPSPLSSRPREAPPKLQSPKPAALQSQTQVTPMSGASAPSTPKTKPSPAAGKPPIHSKPIRIPSKSPISTTTPRITANSKEDDASSDDSFVSASDYSYKPSWRAELASQNRRLTAASIKSATSSVTVDSLANAIVASSLASSRAASPSKTLPQNTTGGLYPPIPPPRRAKHHHTNLFHIVKDPSRTPSPKKPGNGAGGGGMLRTTMRKVRSKEEIDEGEKRRGRKNLMKKHPNKHHEGDRKRWRDSITERERKRYEAVWASNRGLYTTTSPSTSSTSLPNASTDPNFLGNSNANSSPEGLPVDPPNEVLSLVARDIFSRSRLHTDVLEEVYALVDRRGVGNLAKEEFVVGLWLVDQRLKGRKLPIRVSESVWRSVGVLGGIKVKRAKH